MSRKSLTGPRGPAFRRRYLPAVEGLEVRVTPTTLPAGFTEAAVVSGLTNPTAMEFSPDGRLFVLEQGGNVKLVHADGTTWTALKLNVDSNGERGLLGIAFDPAFATNHYAYLYYTNPNPGASSWATGEHNQLSRFTVNDANPLQPVFTNEAPILDWNNLSAAANHNGGAIHFGLDGKLYADAGDNVQTFTQGGVSYRVSQSLATLLGKQLRIDVSAFNRGVATRDDVSFGHLIPADNPFVGTATGINQLIYALGLRNPYTFAVQPGTGTIFINDVGENTWEEIDQSAPGANFGWSGGNTDGFGHPDPPGPGTYHDPLLAYNHSGGPAGGGDAIVGGAFYNPANPQFPASYIGKYFYEDLVAGWIRVFDPANPGTAANPDTSTAFAGGTPGNLRDLKVDAAGNLYYLSGTGGVIEKISYQAPRITAQPASRTVTRGGSATFSVTATGPALSYQWQHLLGTTWNDLGTNAPALTIANLSASDAGGYRVVVANTFGSATSDTATLTVNPAAAGPVDYVIGFDDQVYTRALDASGVPTGGYIAAGYGRVKDLAATRFGGGPGVEAFVIGTDDQVYAETFDSGNHTAGYVRTASGSLSSLSAGTDAAGNPLLFGVGTDNQLYELTFDAAGNARSGRYTRGAFGSFQSVNLTHDQGGDPLLYAVGQDDLVYGLKLDPSGAPVGAPFRVDFGRVKQLVVGHDAASDPELFVIGFDDRAYTHQLGASGSPVGPYVGLGGAVTSIAVSPRAAGNPELFAVGTDGQVYGHNFDTAGNPTGSFFRTAAATGGASAVYAAASMHGNATAFVVFTSNNAIYAEPFDANGASAGPFSLTAPGEARKAVVV